MSPLQVFETRRLPVAAGDEVGTVEGLALPDRHRNERQPAAVRHEGKAADPGRIELPREKKRGDFLVGAPRDQPDRRARRVFQVGAQAVEKFEIRGQKDGGQAEPEFTGGGRSPGSTGQRCQRDRMLETTSRRDGPGRSIVSSRPVSRTVFCQPCYASGHAQGKGCRSRRRGCGRNRTKEPRLRTERNSFREACLVNPALTNGWTSCPTPLTHSSRGLIEGSSFLTGVSRQVSRS